MGFNLFGSSKKTNTTTQNTTNTEETGVQVSGDESVGVGKAGVVNVTDGGAFADALSFARDVIEIPGQAVDAIADTAQESLSRGFNFGEELFGGALDFAGDFSNAQTDRITDFARGVVTQQTEALNTIAREQTKSGDERVQEIAKYVVIGVVALGLIFAVSRS